jgi:hypothetical protein
MDVLNGHLLLAAASVSFERLDLSGGRPGELVKGVLSDVQAIKANRAARLARARRASRRRLELLGWPFSSTIMLSSRLPRV